MNELDSSGMVPKFETVLDSALWSEHSSCFDMGIKFTDKCGYFMLLTRGLVDQCK